MNTQKQTRREWLTIATAAVAVPMFIPRTVFADARRPGANDRIGIAGIGVGRQGAGIFANAVRDARANAVAICDGSKVRGIEVAAERGVPENSVYQDYRKVIDRKDVDAIVTATPEQWRSLICVNAALAGKHLFVEKPVTLTVEDGVLIRKAAKETGIVFQSGSQQRSDLPNYLACKAIREGKLGKITEIIAANYESPWIDNMPGEPVPEGLDWDLWCGPAKLVPFNSQILIARGDPGWISFRAYSGGEMTGWGTHGLDQIQCALGMDETGPVEIFVDGPTLVPPVYDKPESRQRGEALCSVPYLSYKYANGITVRLGVFEERDGQIVKTAESNRGGGIFVGEKGKVEIFRNRVTSNPSELAEEWLNEGADVRLPSHMTDWINCIYDGKKPICDMEAGIRCASLCHILNIARYVGRNLKWDPVKEEFVGDAEANTWLKREHRKGFEQPVVV